MVTRCVLVDGVVTVTHWANVSVAAVIESQPACADRESYGSTEKRFTSRDTAALTPVPRDTSIMRRDTLNVRPAIDDKRIASSVIPTMISANANPARVRSLALGR